MAKQVFTNGYFMLNAVDLSDHVRSITVNTSSDIVDDTTMQTATYAREKIVGLDDWSIDVDWAQDYAASKVDATVWAIRTGRVAVAIIAKPNGGTTAVTNPKWTGSVVLGSYNPIGGGVGDLATATTHFEGTGVLTRATSD